jgi:hypothetical protein
LVPIRGDYEVNGYRALVELSGSNLFEEPNNPTAIASSLRKNDFHTSKLPLEPFLKRYKTAMSRTG